MCPPPLTYLDHAATTPVAPEVLQAMADVYASPAANASSLHRAGVAASYFIVRARYQVATALGTDTDRLTFTSGGTEANNLAIQGVALAGNRRSGHLVCSAIEHPSVLEPMRWLAGRGFDLTVLPVDGQGRVCPDDLAHSLRPDTVLVSIIHGNNELGVIQDLQALGEVCRGAGVPFHSDACQSFTKVALEPDRLPVDLLSINAHKIHGPQGVGALWHRQGQPLEPTLHGGGQEHRLRSGTLNTAGITGFGAAATLSSDATRATLLSRHRQMVEGIQGRLPQARINSPIQGGLPHILNVTFTGADGKKLFHQLNRAGFMISLGSACHATAATPSHVLTAIGKNAEEALSTVRISHGQDTSPEQISTFLDMLGALLAT